MLKLREGIEVYVFLEPIDMRKAMNGLFCLVVEEFKKYPQSDHLFLFFNKGRDKVKIIYWDRN